MGYTPLEQADGDGKQKAEGITGQRDWWRGGCPEHRPDGSVGRQRAPCSVRTSEGSSLQDPAGELACVASGPLSFDEVTDLMLHQLVEISVTSNQNAGLLGQSMRMQMSP